MTTTITNRVAGLASGGQTVRVTGLSALGAVWNAWGTSWANTWGNSWVNTASHSALGLTDRVTGLATANNTNRVTGI